MGSRSIGVSVAYTRNIEDRSPRISGPFGSESSEEQESCDERITREKWMHTDEIRTEALPRTAALIDPPAESLSELELPRKKSPSGGTRMDSPLQNWLRPSRNDHGNLFDDFSPTRENNSEKGSPRMPFVEHAVQIPVRKGRALRGEGFRFIRARGKSLALQNRNRRNLSGQTPSGRPKRTINTRTLTPIRINLATNLSKEGTSKDYPQRAIQKPLFIDRGKRRLSSNSFKPLHVRKSQHGYGPRPSNAPNDARDKLPKGVLAMDAPSNTHQRYARKDCPSLPPASKYTMVHRESPSRFNQTDKSDNRGRDVQRTTNGRTHREKSLDKQPSSAGRTSKESKYLHRKRGWSKHSGDEDIIPSPRRPKNAASQNKPANRRERREPEEWRSF